ncbi:hypothetical protein C0J52_19306 [Blattella germanica]|nr:hypothetical protein C0J52_19306 [Blattella germanica]
MSFFKNYIGLYFNGYVKESNANRFKMAAIMNRCFENYGIEEVWEAGKESDRVAVDLPPVKIMRLDFFFSLSSVVDDSFPRMRE